MERIARREGRSPEAARPNSPALRSKIQHLQMKTQHFRHILLFFCLYFGQNWALGQKIGAPVDSLNGVIVYYNGDVNHVLERNTSKDGYNLGLKYQCVEFVKRYYYQHLKHKMPDSYGHAKDFFNPRIKDGAPNPARNLRQYRNPSLSKPKVDDLIVFGATPYNPYGHVAIISRVDADKIEIIQQNPGATGNSRDTYTLSREGAKWRIEGKYTLGWLRSR
jgi:surface antigen